MLPNNVLVVGPSHTHKRALCGHLAKKYTCEQSFAGDSGDVGGGSIFRYDLATKYYRIKLNVMVDEIEPHTDHFDRWAAEFLHSDCRELRDEVDGVVFTVPEWDEERLLLWLVVVDKVRSSLEDRFIVVAGENMDYAEDLCIAYGIEWVDLLLSGKNEFKESLGFDRIVEVMETHEWHHVDTSGSEYEARKMAQLGEMTRGLLENEEDESQGFDLDLVLQKLQQAKLKVSELSEEEKKEYVDSVVEDVLNFV